MSNSKVKKIFVLSFIFLFGQKAWPYELPSSVSSIRVNSNDTVMTLSDGGTRVVTKSTRFLGRVLSYLSGVLNIIVGSPAGMSNVGEGLCYEHYSYEADRGESTTRLSPDGPSYAAAAVLIMSNPELLVVPLSACVATISFILFAKNAQTADRICLQPDKSLEFGHFASNHIWARAKLSEGTYITPDGIAIRGKFKNGEIARDSEPEIILLNGDGYSIRFNH
ncbi:MAG: hypothetical protein LBB24_01335, partial [Rickettsiales bacterium]|nr:hypothetical protein [Rickettsiales bacterium]